MHNTKYNGAALGNVLMDLEKEIEKLLDHTKYEYQILFKDNRYHITLIDKNDNFMYTSNGSFQDPSDAVEALFKVYKKGQI